METLSFKRRKVGNKIFFCTHAVSSDCIVIVSESLFFFSNKQTIDSINNYPFFLLYWYFVSVYSKNSRKNLFWIDLNMINPDKAIMEVLNVAVSRDSYLTVWRSRTSTFFHCSALVIPPTQLCCQFNDHESFRRSRDHFVRRILFLCVRSVVAFTMFTCAVVRGPTFAAADTVLSQLILNQAWLLRRSTAGRRSVWKGFAQKRFRPLPGLWLAIVPPWWGVERLNITSKIKRGILGAPGRNVETRQPESLCIYRMKQLTF